LYKDNILQLEATGYSPDFAHEFLLSDTDVSVIVLQNTRDLDDFKKTFRYHLAILNAVRG
jgi:hypothetical protein